MNEENTGPIGEAFIEKHLQLGYTLEEAWDEWERLQDTIQFVTVECPEVRFYKITDKMERARLRSVAKSFFGDHIRSPDVSTLCCLAISLGVSIPIRKYVMDSATAIYVAEALKEAIDSDHHAEQDIDVEAVEYLRAEMQEFAETHGLWAVPPRVVGGMWLNHLKRVLVPKYHCQACGHESNFDGTEMLSEQVCAECKCNQLIVARFQEDGELDIEAIYKLTS